MATMIKNPPPPATFTLTLNEKEAEELFQLVSHSSGGDTLYSTYNVMRAVTGFCCHMNWTY